MQKKEKLTQKFTRAQAQVATVMCPLQPLAAIAIGVSMRRVNGMPVW